MNFWKLVAAIVVGNILTGVVAAVIWLLLLAGELGSLRGSATNEVPSSFPTFQDRTDKSAAWKLCVEKAKDAVEAVKCSEIE